MSNIEKYNHVFSEVMSVSSENLANLKFKESENWDSVGHMTLISALEDAFDIFLEVDDMMSITSYDKGKEVLSKYGVDL
jgi:acyl carrier protein